MITSIALTLLLLTITLSLGGGLYEVLVIYPNWKHHVHPSTLTQKLASSGQLNAGKRFWPLVSPAQGLLAIINLIMAWNCTGQAQTYWFAAALIVFVTRVSTFSYFIPVMVRQIMKPENIAPTRLKAIVKTWTSLSPWRLLPEFAAWVLLIMALTRLK